MNKRLRKWIATKMKRWVDKQIRKDHKALLDAKRDELTVLLRATDIDFVGIAQNGIDVGALLIRIGAFQRENGEEFDEDEEAIKFYAEALEAV